MDTRRNWEKDSKDGRGPCESGKIAQEAAKSGRIRNRPAKSGNSGDNPGNSGMNRKKWGKTGVTANPFMTSEGPAESLEEGTVEVTQQGSILTT